LLLLQTTSSSSEVVSGSKSDDFNDDGIDIISNSVDAGVTSPPTNNVSNDKEAIFLSPIGPPVGTKIRMLQAPETSVNDGRYFERTLTRFTTPEELFGPLSLKALEEDRYERRVEGFLPQAEVKFME
jgi:hypothetical protein